ncbi:MAG: Coenzyme F420 hydrogenase/dehydrogenase, beta subunit C-terminal domain [Candidatus Sigynarchaeota archaeon]
MAQQESSDKIPYAYLQTRIEKGKDAFGKLMKEVVKSGVCCACSACVATCDVLDWVDNEPKLVGKCTGCGVCYNQCPRTKTVPQDLIGSFQAAYIAKSKVPDVKGQDGGTVTTLLLFMLEKRLIDGAVVTKHDESWRAIPAFVNTREDILAASGSLYVHSQTVRALFKALKAGNHAVAFVGTPCNIDAVDKMQKSPYGMILYNLRANVVKIGLFCMDSFEPETLYGFFERDGVSLKDVGKMNIASGKFNIFNKQGEKLKEYRISQLNRYKSSSCNFCTDLTSEAADVSVGSVGSPEGYNTVLCRTTLGQLLVEDAAAHGYLEIKPLEHDGLETLLKLARMKKVSQYTVNVRTQYVFTTPETPGETSTQRTVVQASNLPKTPFLAKKLKLKNVKLSSKTKTVRFSLDNESGYTMEGLDLRISLSIDVFEKIAWRTSVAELYPYESMVFDYPLSVPDDQVPTLEILIDVRTATDNLLSEKISIKKLLEDEAVEKVAKEAAKEKKKGEPPAKEQKP